jgi:3-isopropylmalate dehydratase small subunit
MAELKQHTMEAYRPEFAQQVRPGDILVAGRNFGCGSSRPGIVLREVGIAAVVVESVSRLFLRNNIARALPIFMAPGINGIVEDGDIIEIDYRSGRVANAGDNRQVALRKFPPLIEQIFEAGGLPEFAFQRYCAEYGAGGRLAKSGPG